MHCRYECRLATWCRQGPLHWSTDIHVLQRTASLLVQVANCPRLQPMAGCKKPKGEITLRCQSSAWPPPPPPPATEPEPEPPGLSKIDQLR
jgi:hypothetical protein